MHFNEFLNSKSGRQYYMGLNTKSMEREEAEAIEQGDVKKMQHLVEDDYTQTLARKHMDKHAKRQIKYWERERKSHSCNKTSDKGGKPLKSPKLSKAGHKEKDLEKAYRDNQADALFVAFRREGLDDPDKGAPHVEIERQLKIKKLLEENSNKNVPEHVKHSFFFVKRNVENVLQEDVAFQYRLAHDTEKFRQRRTKGANHGDTISSSDSDVDKSHA